MLHKKRPALIPTLAAEIMLGPEPAEDIASDRLAADDRFTAREPQATDPQAVRDRARVAHQPAVKSASAHGC